ncbi:MAG: polysaccharide deacetylase family protein [Lachnospiraceae bacterium]|nr:polysaccharide deacetylase family protein [Lachnospiraceae bacterium]
MKKSICSFLICAVLTLGIIDSITPGSGYYGGNDISSVSAKTKTDYSKYNNTKSGFGLSLNKEHKKPGGTLAKGVKKLSSYNAYYVDEKAAKKKKKVIYLTFDCGYENGYTKTILKTLKKNKIKAIFFVTEPYIKANPKLVKRMKKDGHLVGNHTCTHPQLPTKSVSQIRKEVSQCEKTMKKLTGYSMDKYIRPPEGCYSQRTLKVLQDMGYSTIFWSLAWHDWDPSNQPGKSSVVNQFKTYYHPGMMPLIHVVSKSNTEALPEVISFMKKKGYKFGLISDFALKPGEKAKKTTKKSATEKTTTEKATTENTATEKATTEKATTENTTTENITSEK